MIQRSVATLLIVLLAGLLLPMSVLAATPVADDDTITVAEDSNASIVDVLDGDTDVDEDPLEIQSATNPAHGTVVVAPDNLTVTYKPDANYHGSDSFDYVVTDGLETDEGSVDVTVTSVNDDPTADNETLHVTEDTNETISVLVGDDDIDGDTLTISAKTNGTKGTVSAVDGDTKVEYDPNLNATGTDSFTYTASDGHGGEDTATVSITIDAVNDAPVADDENASIGEDAGPTFIDVLDGDTDVDDADDSLVVSVVTQGGKGSVAISSGGSGVSYNPNLNATGGDTFTYTVSDGSKTDVGTVTVTINGENDTPNAVNDSYTINEDITTSFNVRSNDTDGDGDTLSITDISNPAKGSASEQGGQISYNPDQDANGADSFTYKVSDGHGGEDTATVSVTITPINDDPIALDDEFPVLEDAAATILPVLAGDTDPDGDALSITSKTNGLKGTVSVTDGTVLKYDPRTNEVGADSFTYTISDGHGGTDTATVTVEIGGSNDMPNAVSDTTMSVPQGAGAVVLDVLGNDSDPDGDAFSIASIKAASHGTVTITGNGTGLTYNPAGLYKGTDTFKYTITDGSQTDEATVVVTVVADTVDPVVVAPAQRLLGQTVGSSTTKVRITWSATDTGGVGVSSYKLQVSTNGGSYKTLTLSKSTSTSTDRTLTNGKTYRFRVRATDKEGNVSSYAYGPTFSAVRSSQESSQVAYVGSWSKTSSSKHLGGSARNGTSPSKSATFSFTGYDVGWIAARTSSSGKAQILVDGALVKTLDLDQSSTTFRKLVFQQHFSTSGPHTLQIKPVGDGRVYIDGFMVLK